MDNSAQWSKWLKIAKSAARDAAKDWLKRSQVTVLVINGPTGTVKPGGLGSRADFRATMAAKMTQSGAPAAVVAAMSGPLAQAWNAWFAGYQVQLMYPTFAAIPGPAAPPTPCQPQPLKAGVSSNAHRVTSASLEREIKSALGKAAVEPGAPQAVSQLTTWFADRFAAWQTVGVISNVMGRGRVPAFAPPYVPVGPVVGGDALVTSTSAPLSDHGVFDVGL